MHYRVRRSICAQLTTAYPTKEAGRIQHPVHMSKSKNHCGVVKEAVNVPAPGISQPGQVYVRNGQFFLLILCSILTTFWTKNWGGEFACEINVFLWFFRLVEEQCRHTINRVVEWPVHHRVKNGHEKPLRNMHLNQRWITRGPETCSKELFEAFLFSIYCSFFFWVIITIVIAACYASYL